MALGDREREGEAKARALAGRLRREEGFEEAGAQLLGNPGAAVLDAEEDFAAGRAQRRDANLATGGVFDRVLGVGDEVDHHLQQLRVARPHRRQVVSEVEGHRDPGAALRNGAQFGDFPREVVEADAPARTVFSADEAEQVARDLRGSARLALDQRDDLAVLAGEGLVLEQHGRQAVDPHQRVIHLVRHTGGQAPDRRELLRFEQLLLRAADLRLGGDVLGDQHRAAGRVRRERQLEGAALCALDHPLGARAGADRVANRAVAA